MIIYLTTNKVNGKKYIGMDTNNDPNYLGSGKILKYAINKYGKKKFVKEVLEECGNLVELQEREKYWITFYDAVKSEDFYNITKGGTGGDCFSGLSDKDKERNRALKSEIATKYNIMHKKTVFQCWVDKYGMVEAKEKLENQKRKISMTNNINFNKKKNRLAQEYGEYIVNNYGKLTLDGIHKELDGVVSKRIIKIILKENGINLLSRVGVNKGTNNGQSKLTCGQVKEILELKNIHTNKKISEIFNISQSSINNIMNGIAYRCCFEPPYQKGNKNLAESKNNLE